MTDLSISKLEPSRTARAIIVLVELQNATEVPLFALTSLATFMLEKESGTLMLNTHIPTPLRGGPVHLPPPRCEVILGGRSLPFRLSVPRLVRVAQAGRREVNELDLGDVREVGVRVAWSRTAFRPILSKDSRPLDAQVRDWAHTVERRAEVIPADDASSEFEDLS